MSSLYKATGIESRGRAWLSSTKGHVETPQPVAETRFARLHCTHNAHHPPCHAIRVDRKHTNPPVSRPLNSHRANDNKQCTGEATANRMKKLGTQPISRPHAILARPVRTTTWHIAITRAARCGEADSTMSYTTMTPQETVVSWPACSTNFPRAWSPLPAPRCPPNALL